MSIFYSFVMQRINTRLHRPNHEVRIAREDYRAASYDDSIVKL